MAKRPRTSGLLPFVLSAPIAAWAGDWSLTPVVAVSERFTDNVALTATAAESSFITEIVPGFRLKKQGGRGQASVDYGLQSLLYSHDGGTNANHQLSALLKSELIEDALTLEGNARITQQNANLVGRVGAGNYNTTGNLVETRYASLTPAWRSRFGSTALLDVRWQVSQTDSEGGANLNALGNELNLSLTSGTAYHRTPWNLAWRRNDTDVNDSRLASLSGTLGYVVSPKTRFNLTVGADDNNGNTTGFNRASGPYWNLGVNWAPSVRTSLAATAGRRYGGPAFSLNLTQRNRRASVALRYSEDLTDTLSQITATGAYDIYLCNGAPVPVLAGSPSSAAGCGNAAILLLAAQPLTFPLLINDISLSKVWSGIATYKATKSAFSLNYSRHRRELLTSGSRDSAATLSGNWTWTLGPRTTATLTLAQTSAENSTGDSDDWSLAWQLSRQLSKTATGILEWHRVERTSGTTGGYAENSVSARVNMSF